MILLVDAAYLWKGDSEACSKPIKSALETAIPAKLVRRTDG
jgi:hypothetical protein